MDDFHSHSASLTGSCPWCGGAYLAGRPPICASSAALSPHLQAVVHSGPLLTVTWWCGPIRPLCDNADPFIFCSWSKNLEWASSRSKAPPKRAYNKLCLLCLIHACSQFHHLLKTVLFRLTWVGSASE